MNDPAFEFPDQIGEYIRGQDLIQLGGKSNNLVVSK
jgi:hypothetical protein